MMKKLIFLSAIFVLLSSCNSGNKKETNSKTTSETSNQSEDDTSYNCLKDFKDDYDTLLTKEDMSSVYDIDFDEAKETLTSGSYGEHSYTWPSDRPSFTMEVNGMKMDLPDKNIMGIKNLSFYSDKTELKSVKGTFDMGYKELSDEELQKIEDNMSKVEDEKVKQTGDELMEVRKKRNSEFVDHLGSSAWYRWNDDYGGELTVLAGRANFSIVSKVSNDPDENRELARKLAEKVIQKCN